jgi:hypothetical protein
MADNAENLSEQIDRITQRYAEDARLLRGDAYGDGGTYNLMARLRRAGHNQVDGGESTLSRYAIWANCVRDHIAVALEKMDEDRDEAERLLRAAHNSLSAFSEIQVLFDPRRREGE